MQPIRDYLGGSFNPAYPTCVSKIDKLFAACVEMKRDGNVIKYKDKRSHEISLLHVPKSSTDRSFHEKNNGLMMQWKSIANIRQAPVSLKIAGVELPIIFAYINWML